MHDHLANIIAKLNRLNPDARRLLIQLPNGLRMRAVELVQSMEKHGYEPLLAADACFGACDLPLAAAAAVKPDAILHIGHIPFYRPIKTDIPVVYYEWPIEAKLDEARLAKEIGRMKERRIGLVSSVQYQNILPLVSDLIRKTGKSADIGGHVLGCWAKPAEKLAPNVDALMFVGSGTFHPHGFACDYFLDLERNEIRDVRTEINKWQKIRWGRIAKAKNAKTFGILVSTKPGQLDVHRAKKIKLELERRDKKAFIFIMDNITDTALLGLDVDAFINMACPRLADDKWSRPFINAADVDKLFDANNQ